MITLPKIWNILETKMPRSRWISLKEIYILVQKYGDLDDEDGEPQAPGSGIPKWKRNVRNVLQYRKKTGEVEWGHDAHYKI
jgi:hypothetical protein